MSATASWPASRKGSLSCGVPPTRWHPAFQDQILVLRPALSGFQLWTVALLALNSWLPWNIRFLRCAAWPDDTSGRTSPVRWRLSPQAASFSFRPADLFQQLPFPLDLLLLLRRLTDGGATTHLLIAAWRSARARAATGGGAWLASKVNARVEGNG